MMRVPFLSTLPEEEWEIYHSELERKAVVKIYETGIGGRYATGIIGYRLYLMIPM